MRGRRCCGPSSSTPRWFLCASHLAASSCSLSLIFPTSYSVCLLFPSRLLTEPRESFLIRDHYSHVARPKHHFKTAPPFKVHRVPEFLTGTVVVSWAIVCVCVAKLTDVLA